MCLPLAPSTFNERGNVATLVEPISRGVAASQPQIEYLLIDEGMSEREVNALLGSPTESQGFNAYGFSSTLSRWVASDAAITVRFVNGKARIKTFDKPPPQ